jgi:putative SOS response-associated peptidase YedK
MAGIWAPWKNPKTGEMEHTFAILTGEANAVMRPVHDREPVIIEPREYGEYLAREARPSAHLLRILPEDELKGRLVAQ